jgi:hypothetical protein
VTYTWRCFFVPHFNAVRVFVVVLKKLLLSSNKVSGFQSEARSEWTQACTHIKVGSDCAQEHLRLSITCTNLSALLEDGYDAAETSF